MEKNSTGRTRTLACPQCEALNYATAERCWLCGATLPMVEEIPKLVPRAPVTTDRDPAPGPVGGFSLASLLLLMTLASVLLGMISIAPGLGVPLAVVAFIAWMRTFNVVHHRALRGGEVRPQEKVVMFVTSFGNTLVLIIMVIVAAGAAFFTACTAMFALGEPNGEVLKEIGPYALLAILIFAALLFAIVRMVRANKRRWRRDIGAAPEPTDATATKQTDAK